MSLDESSLEMSEIAEIGSLSNTDILFLVKLKIIVLWKLLLIVNI